MTKNLFDHSANALVNFSRLWGRQAWIIFLILLGFSLTLIFPYAAQSRSEPELRGVWLTNIDSEVLFKKDSLSEAIDNLQQLNFNTLYPTIWNWGHTLYPSQVAKPVTGTELDPAKGLQGRDMLQEIVTQGHKDKMTVIPWFEFGFMAPADSELAKRNDQWLTQRPNGDKIWLEGNVHKRVWLNPLHPEVQQFITNLITEIVTKYEVDGIQVDDHFGIPFDFGYDDITVKLYQQEHNGKSPPKPPQDIKIAKNCIVDNADWQEWTQWRINKITGYMTQLVGAIKATNPKLIVSVSPNPQTFSANCYLLDWQTWQQKGLIEELVLQVYRPNLESFQREISRPEVQETKKRIPFGVGILSGLKGRPVSMKQIKAQVEAARQQELAGVSFFFYESLWNLSEEPLLHRQSILKNLFPTGVSRPSIGV